ncbi:hypothetical protein ACFL7D_07690 [candidate division KSB1 bacterium]
MKFGYREKLIAVGAAILLIVVAWYFFYYQPKLDEISRLEEEIKTMQGSIDQKNYTLADIESLKNEIQKLQEEARENVALSVSYTRMSYVNDVINEKINYFGLKLTDPIRPNTNLLFQQNPLDQLEIDTGIRKVDFLLKLEGTFENLVAFMEGLKDFPFLIRAVEFDASTDDDLFPTLIVSLKVIVFFDMTGNN